MIGVVTWFKDDDCHDGLSLLASRSALFSVPLLGDPCAGFPLIPIAESSGDPAGLVTTEPLSWRNFCTQPIAALLKM